MYIIPTTVIGIISQARTFLVLNEVLVPISCMTWHFLKYISMNELSKSYGKDECSTIARIRAQLLHLLENRDRNSVFGDWVFRSLEKVPPDENNKRWWGIVKSINITFKHSYSQLKWPTMENISHTVSGFFNNLDWWLPTTLENFKFITKIRNDSLE